MIASTKANSRPRRLLWPIIGVAIIAVVIGSLWLFTDGFTVDKQTHANNNFIQSPIITTGTVRTPTTSTKLSETKAITSDMSVNTKPVVSIDGKVTLAIDGETDYEFQPRHSGRWIIETSDNINSDPYVEIYGAVEVKGSNGSATSYEVIANDDNGTFDDNAFIYMDMYADTVYPMSIKFNSGSKCTLTIRPVYAGESIPGHGGQVAVTGVTEYAFTPEQSGVWEFRTYRNMGDPTLRIFDENGTIIAYDDNSGDGKNAYISMYLESECTYFVSAGYSFGQIFAYMLDVSYASDATDAVSVTIPSTGGEAFVTRRTMIEFTPAFSSIWIIETTDSETADPYLWLYDNKGNERGYDDDTYGLDAAIEKLLFAGTTYNIYADSHTANHSGFVVTITPPDEIPNTGGEVLFDTMTLFTFKPVDYGIWQFRTTGEYATEICIIDESTNSTIYSDNNRSDDNALLLADLDNGKIYQVVVSFVGNEGPASLQITKN